MSNLKQERKERQEQDDKTKDIVMNNIVPGIMDATERDKWNVRRKKEQWAYEDGMSFDQAVNKLNILEEDLKKPVKVNKAAINTTSVMDARKFVRYAISLLPSDDRSLVMGEILLRRSYGLEYAEIGKEFGVSPDMIKMFEEEGIKRVQDAIVKTKNSNKVPIVGGLN